MTIYADWIPEALNQLEALARGLDPITVHIIDRARVEVVNSRALEDEAPEVALVEDPENPKRAGVSLKWPDRHVLIRSSGESIRAISC